VSEVLGESQLEQLTISNRQTGAQETVPARALFIFIGAMP
jgi:thioredoxin reductase